MNILFLSGTEEKHVDLYQNGMYHKCRLSNFDKATIWFLTFLKVSCICTLYVYVLCVLGNSFNIYMQLSSGASCLSSGINLQICHCSLLLI